MIKCAAIHASVSCYFYVLSIFFHDCAAYLEIASENEINMKQVAEEGCESDLFVESIHYFDERQLIIYSVKMLCAHVV